MTEPENRDDRAPGPPADASTPDLSRHPTTDSGQVPAESTANERKPFVAKLLEEDNTDTSTDPLKADTRRNVGNEIQDPAGESMPEIAPTVNVGSPFRQDPGASRADPSQRSLIDFGSGEPGFDEFGPFRYTAMGAASAAAMVLFFAAIGAWWFPPGGALVALLGTLLAFVGMFARRRFRFAAVGCLLIHVALFFVSYLRSVA
jgi:hypothetical protein